MVATKDTNGLGSGPVEKVLAGDQAQISKTHIKARWVWRPACNPSTQEVETGDSPGELAS